MGGSSPEHVEAGPPRAVRELEPARSHLEHLYEIGKRLAGFVEVERTFPEVMVLAARTLSLRTAVLLVEPDPGGESGLERPLRMAWRAEGVPAEQLSIAAERAVSAQASLMEPGARAWPEPPGRAEPGFVTLPLRGRGCVLGSLQVEVARALVGEEGAFLDAVAQQLAVALDWHHALRREVRLRELLLRERQAHQQALEAVRWREELLAVVSHDIKTPLLVVRLNAEMLLQSARPPGEERRRHGRRQLESILRASEQMRELIGGLLDRARLQGMPPPLALQPWPVDELFRQAVEVLQPLASSKSQVLVMEVSPEPPRVSVDRERILQVLSNLVDNAIKFTPAKGTITLRARKEQGRVRISVQDTGPGIPPEDAPHLFERFWRASGVSERGTGLGLSIVKSLVEAHGGTVWVESRMGEGSTFFLTLPEAAP